MIKSMTGYGRGCVKLETLEIEAEARSVNNRFSNVNIKLPRQLSSLENQAWGYVNGRYQRGKLDVFINIRYFGGNQTIQLDVPLSQQYYQALKQLKQEFNLPHDVTLELMARNPNIFETSERQQEEEIWPALEGALKECLDNLDAMQKTEGENIAHDILSRCRFLSAGITNLEPLLAKLPNIYMERLKTRLADNLPGVSIGDDRLIQEIALCATRCDATEEVVRFKSHLKQFQDWIEKESGPVGKKLDFLVQEIHRELNTMCSKVNDSQFVQAAVGLKSELEKIKEQVQNIE
ncbi:MAG: YicC family protein [Candidatus Schekmanbacteria bacterium]|nr:YicC family protein [Candidatus Schekmanbacteria bacterium]